jgi:hypothetical protein
LSEKGRDIIMRKKLIYLISFVVALSLASITYGDGFVIGNFEGDSMDGWGPETPSNPNITLTLSTVGATLDGNSLKIADSTGNGFDRAAAYSCVANDTVNEFRKHTKVSLDLTRLNSEWDGAWGGWNGGHNSFQGYCEFHMIVEAGSTEGTPWAKGWELTQIANWGSWNGDSPINFTYDYSTLLNQIDFNNLTYLGIILCTNWGNYGSGGVYYIDNVKLVGEGMAYEPNPANHAVDVQTDSNLIWTPGAGAVSHDVYFGTNFNDVNDANRTNPRGVLKSQGQVANTYDPTLALYTTYFWRIDEVNGLNIQKGAVWDFMTAYAGMGVVIGDWENGMNGWGATWQGKTTFSYSTKGATLGNYSLGVQPVKNTEQDPGYWIIKRDELLDLTNMKLQVDVTLLAAEWSGQTVHLGPLVVQTDLPVSWNIYTPSIIDRNTGLLASDVWGGAGAINAYRTLTFDFTGPDSMSYTHTDWADANKMTIMLALQNGAQGPGKFYLDNARLVNVFLAGNPMPANRATDIPTTPTLSWAAGNGATSHDVYFGTDATAVTNATRSNQQGVLKSQGQTGLTYAPSTLTKNTTYYWRIDEWGAAGSPWKGLLWNFTTAEYVFVDNFESYASIMVNKLAATWAKGGGGYVGYPDANPKFAETTIVHGGVLSMPFDYNNAGSLHDSNATRTFTGDPCDWTAEGVKSLELWYRGWPAAVGSFTGSGPYTITASGEDVWDVPALRGTGYHDECHYAYKAITGATGLVTIIAKVESVSNTSPWAKAGVMIRQSLDPNSKNGFMCITPEMGAAFQYRVNDADVSTSYDYQMEGYESMADISAPYWVKLEIYTPGYLWAYYSANGTDWVSVTSDSPELALPIYVGLAVTAHNAAATCTAEFSSVSITAPGTISSWSNQDIGIKSNVAAPLYVTLQDNNNVGSSDSNKATVTHTDPNVVLQNTWQAWDIALNDFKVVNPALNLAKIKKITLGVGSATPNGTGTLYFDDIRLYPPRCMPNKTGDFNGDCFIDYDDLQILANNWLSSPADPNIDLNKDSKINFKEYAILASQWLSAAVWPY